MIWINKIMHDLTRTRDCEPLFFFQRTIVTVFGLCLRVLILLGWCGKPIDRKHIDDVANILKKGYQNIASGLECIANDKLVCIGPQWGFKFLDNIGIRLYGFNSRGLIVINPEIFDDFDENKLIELQKTLIHEASAVYGKSHDECIYLENIIPYSIKGDAGSFSKETELEYIRKIIAKRTGNNSKYASERSFFYKCAIFFFDLSIFRLILVLLNKKNSLNPQRIKRILIIAVSGIGDAIMQTPTIELLSQKFPKAKIYAMVNPGSFEVFKNNPHIFRMILTPKMTGCMLRFGQLIEIVNLFFKRINLCILDDTMSGIKGRLIALVIGAKYRVGPMSINPVLNYLNNENSNHGTECHRVLTNIFVLERTSLANVGKDRTNFEPHTRLYITKGDRHKARMFLERNALGENRFILGIHSGSNIMQIYRRWPEHKFIDLGIRLKSEFPDIPIVMFSGPDEIEQTRNIAEYIDQAIVAEGMTLLQTAALIERCNLMISNDSGLAHVASAVDTPVVAIFGPCNPFKTGPWGNIQNTIRIKLPCSNCYEEFRFLEACNKAVWCLNNFLEVDEVFEVVRRKILTQLSEYGFVNRCFVRAKRRKEFKV